MKTSMQKEKNWLEGTLGARFSLTKEGSTKTTFHIVLQFPHPLGYLPGDSLGLLPKNGTAVVKNILSHLPFSGEEIIVSKKTGEPSTLYDFLQNQANLGRVTKRLSKTFQIESFSGDLVDLVANHQAPGLSPQELTELLLPLMPRFYSIASSPTLHPQEIHLTVALAQYELKGAARWGTASSYLCQDLQKGETVQAFIHKAPHFRLPQDASKNLLMIGPGTGIAPFRSFLQERAAQNASGKHWLFFGERQRLFDFYYEDEWEALAKQQELRVDVAFSRDQEDRIYVQNLLEKYQDEVHAWIENGAYIYLCGDAKKMAKDVERTLETIFQKRENLSPEESRLYLRSLKKQGRFLTDVY
ncbi:MAG: sulfite reductase [Chlamydiota bacterium]